ncbi:MAG TPA: cation:proton antiporter [Geminicoccaceae bacterium]|nr:cation:proton antiporter [Geminicoccaceae bacterium]
MEAVHALEPAIVLLLVGILAIVLARPLRVSPIVGYLGAGLALGPHGLGLVPEGETTRLLAELGVVFLLFDIGLHFSLRHIWDARRDILGLGPIQVGLCGLAFGLLALAAGFGGGLAVVLGATLALSSTAVVVQTLAERGQETCPVGLTATAVLIFQDVCAIFLLILAGSLEGAAGGSGLAAAVAVAAVKATLAFAAAVLLGRYAIGPLFRLLSATRNDEVFTVTALLIVLATAAATGSLGLSLTLGAFLGGMIISETPYRHVIRSEVKPFRGLLLGFFFITVGMSLDPHVLLGGWAQVLLVLATLIAIKAALVAAAALAFRWSVPGSVQLGFLLAQGSEFAFVIFAMPAVRAALGPVAAAIAITAVAASLALTPGLASLGRALAGRLRQRLAAPPAETTRRETTAPLVIVGMGEIGRRVADGLEAHGIAYEAVEMDHDRFLAANADGYPVAFGDLGDPRLIETLTMSRRSAIVVTLVRYEVSAALTPILHDRYPNLVRFIGVESAADRERFAALGMRAVVDRSHPKGLDLAATVLRAQGVDDDEVDAWMRRQQERALERATPRAEAAA